MPTAKCMAALALFAGAALAAQTPTDRGVLDRLRAEALEHSQVAPVFEMLTIGIGPRLTASPAEKRAAEWTRDRLASYGLDGAHLEPWHFGRGWTLDRLTIEMVEPRYMPLIGYADGWSPSTSGDVVATPVLTAGKSPEEIAAMHDRLRGAIVMTQPIMTNFVRKDRPDPSADDYVAYAAGYATGVGPRAPTSAAAPAESPRERARRTLAALHEAGAAVLLKPSIGEHGTVFVTGRDNGDIGVPSITLSAEHYNLIARMLERGIPVKLRVNVQTTFHDEDGGQAYNVLAELPGTDPALRDEVVMIGGHLDSWHTAVGATDNADGATTIIEAMRLLKAIGARPRRTIRAALWAGEEQGLFGSRAWVQQHLAGEANRAAREKFDVYYNIDNGTGPILGWFAQESAAAKARFDAWIAPLADLGVRRNTIERIGDTDHVSFVDAGVPGFNPIQSYANYDVRTHHTNMDTVERLQEKDIQQAAIVMAWFAYESAMTDARFERATVR